jgi:hypothetical protein
VNGYHAGLNANPQPSHPPEPVDTHGALIIAVVEPYDPDGWAAKIPSLIPVLNSAAGQFVYTVTTQRIGLLNGDRPHAPSVARFTLGGDLADAQVYLFLDQQTPYETSQRVEVEEVMNGKRRQFYVPAGSANDRLRAVIVSPKNLPELKETFSKGFIIELETP